MVWIKSIQPMAAKLGVRMRMPSLAPRTRLAHEAAAWAAAEGQAEAMNRAIFRAYFENSLDIGKAEILGKVAAGIGLNAAGLGESLAIHNYLPQVLADEAQAQEYGLSGVPAFVWAGHGLVGVPSEKSLLQLIGR